VLEQRGFPLEMLAVGKSGCLPFIGIERFTHRGASNCQDVIVPVIELAKEDFIIDVLITARYTVHVSGKGFGPDAADTRFHIQMPGTRLPPDQVDYPALFRQGVRDTLASLTRQGKNILFVHQVPELNFDPKSCIFRPFSISGMHECKILKSLVEERQKLYREIVTSTLDEFPHVRVFDPTKYLCDETYCYATINNKMMYRDAQHVSNEGAEYLSNEMMGYFILNGKNIRPAAIH
jgi:hypothetical protein